MLKPSRKFQDRQLISAQKKLRQGEYELPDSAELMDSLASLLATKKLRCDSLEFGLIAAMIRKVVKKSKNDKNYELGKKESRYLKVVSKQGLVEYFTGLRLDRDHELSAAVLGHKLSQTEEPDFKHGKRRPKK